jgi:Undecaprenyl-phosphate glucose phosphotransferase
MKLTRLAAGIELISGVPVISVHDSPLAGVQSVFKRVMDIFGALVAITLFAPIMLIVALLVPLSSPGPVFYRQERMGLDGRTFKMLKFRSMPVDAEKKTGAVFASAGDNRATWLGRFLRRTSLDELPQLFNVLLGDMSLVGPRPERPVFVNDFRRKIPGYFLRHKVKAGITGWAQVNGWRGDTSIEKRIECDLYYIQNWSLWFDFRILLLTVVRGFIHRNAY